MILSPNSRMIRAIKNVIIAVSLFRRSGGTFLFRRPGGVDRYLRP